MANIHALITWGSISMIALLISVFYPNINIKERVSMALMISAISAGALCGFTMSVTWGLGISAAILGTIGILMGYEGGE
tara:strand:+ start:365 stop:601 length:237 start_codon:yes stop_codon:yes gene_type:complete